MIDSWSFLLTVTISPHFIRHDLSSSSSTHCCWIGSHSFQLISAELITFTDHDVCIYARLWQLREEEESRQRSPSGAPSTGSASSTPGGSSRKQSWAFSSREDADSAATGSEWEEDSAQEDVEEEDEDREDEEEDVEDRVGEEGDSEEGAGEAGDENREEVEDEDMEDVEEEEEEVEEKEEEEEEEGSDEEGSVCSASIVSFDGELVGRHVVFGVIRVLGSWEAVPV